MTWFRPTLRPPTPLAARRPVPAAPRPAACEPLEQRRLMAAGQPSTFTVTNLLDGGPDSLRAAVAAANANPGADVIDFATTGTIALTSGQLDITDSLTIDGPGAGALTVSGEGLSRVFALAGTPTVLIADLTVANGRTTASPGAGISMAGGTLTLDHCTVSGNSAVGFSNAYGEAGPAAGGGLYVAGGTLVLDQCLVSGNSAVGGDGAGGPFFQAGYSGGSGAGGGLYVTGGTVQVNQSTFSGNLAAGGRGGDADHQYWAGWSDTYGGNGGAAMGGGICVAAGTLEIQQSTIAFNTATGGEGGAGSYPGWSGRSEGGGLYTLPVDPPVTYLDSLTLNSTVNNTPDNVFGPYFLDGLSRLAIGDVSVVEGNDGTTAFVFTVTRTGPSGQSVSVDYATANGTATSAGDYTAASGTLTIPAGQPTGSITVQVNGDRIGESNESFFVNLSNPTNATIADGRGVGTIVDDEPRVAITGTGGQEGNAGTRPFVFTVTLSRAYVEPVVLTYATADNNATAGSDYQATGGTLTFATGETSKTITVLVNGDRVGEYLYEAFFVDLSGAPNAVITGNRGGATILDDEPHISIDDVYKYERKKNQRTQFTFTVALSAAYDQAVTVSFRTADGTAKVSDGDYTARTGTLTFAPGETSKTITIEVKGDNAREPDETFNLELFGASGNSFLADWLGVGTIWNDD